MNPLQDLCNYDQSIWLDYIRRNILHNGELKRLIEEDKIKGLTSNPAIFEKAIAHGDDYNESFAEFARSGGHTAESIYEQLVVYDIQHAADILRGVYDETEGRDGYVSLEVSPKLANDTEATVKEAKRLWTTLARDNVMIKVPATEAGIPAIETLISEGININATLLFSIAMYEQVAQAYIRGVQRLADSKGKVQKIAGVASFFVSRVDSAVDKIIDQRMDAADDKEAEKLLAIRGKVSIANAKRAYQQYRHIFDSDQWDALKQLGARPQRLLWASTGVKNPEYSDVMYIEQLIGPNTVNTVPPDTLDAFRDHGVPQANLEQGINRAEQVLHTAADLGIDLNAVTDKLLLDGVDIFAQAFDKLLAAVESIQAGKKEAVNAQ
jgi:transaldolase/glucose-6-phosphate isomerase